MIWSTEDFAEWVIVGKDFDSDAKEYDGILEQITAVKNGWA